MKNLMIARRYAKALLIIGKEDGQTELYRHELSDFSALIASDNQLDMAMLNPLYNAQGRRNVLKAVLDSVKVSKIMGTFLLLVFDKGRFAFLSHINDHYQKMADELKGIARAKVVGASVLSEETVSKIREALSARTGKEVILDVSQDPDLIGGIVTRIGDLVLDGSIKSQILNMRETFKRGERI